MTNPRSRMKGPIRARLWISGGDPSAVTKLLGIQPDWTAAKGDLISSFGRSRRKDSVWELMGSAEGNPLDVEPYVKSILVRIAGVKDRIAKLDRKIFSVE